MWNAIRPSTASGCRPGSRVQTLRARARVIGEGLARDHITPCGVRARPITRGGPGAATPISGGSCLTRARVQRHQRVESYCRASMVTANEVDEGVAKTRVVGARARWVRLIQ